MADLEILEGAEDIPVVIYHKCTQKHACLLYGKRCLIEKNSDANSEVRPPPTPVKSATAHN